MQNIYLSSYILIAIGAVILVFAVWNRVTINRHLRNFAARSSSPLTDDKYFELRSKQEYIISISAIIVSLATFFGYQGLQTIKEELNTELQEQKKILDSVKNEAKAALSDYINLRKNTTHYSDTVISSLEDVRKLKSQIQSISLKNIIQRGIYLVDGLKINDFPFHSDSLNHVILFANLKTFSGNNLPKFSTSPIVFIVGSSTLAKDAYISHITSTSFEIYGFLISGKNNGSKGQKEVTFDLMIMSKD